MLKNFLLATSLGFITGFELNIGLNVNIQFSEPVKFNYEKEFMNELYNLKKTKEIEHLLNNQEWIQGYVYKKFYFKADYIFCLLYTSPSPRDNKASRMPSSA